MPWCEIILDLIRGFCVDSRFADFMTFLKGCSCSVSHLVIFVGCHKQRGAFAGETHNCFLRTKHCSDGTSRDNFGQKKKACADVRIERRRFPKVRRRNHLSRVTSHACNAARRGKVQCSCFHDCAKRINRFVARVIYLGSGRRLHFSGPTSESTRHWPSRFRWPRHSTPCSSSTNLFSHPHISVCRPPISV